MHSFNTELYNKKIIMISDYVDPSLYNKIELVSENKLIEAFKKQIAKYNIYFEYREFKNLQEIKIFLEKIDPTETIIFNWCEQVEGIENSGHLVTELLESKGFIFTGSGTEALKTTGNKKITKEILIRNNINTPKYIEIKNIDELGNIDIEFPLIVKLSDMHSSIGISKDNIVKNIKDLHKVGRRMFKEFSSPLLIEEYIDGEEYTIPVWGNGDGTELMSICEIEFKDKSIGTIQTEKSKFKPYSKEYLNSPYRYLAGDEYKKIANLLSKDVIKTYKVLGFRDYGRFEVRVKNNTGYLIDANTNPAMCYEDLLFGSTEILGFNEGETVLKICEFAFIRSK